MISRADRVADFLDKCLADYPSLKYKADEKRVYPAYTQYEIIITDIRSDKEVYADMRSWDTETIDVLKNGAWWTATETEFAMGLVLKLMLG